jgi:hypothetical protein
MIAKVSISVNVKSPDLSRSPGVSKLAAFLPHSAGLCSCYVPTSQSDNDAVQQNGPGPDGEHTVF